MAVEDGLLMSTPEGFIEKTGLAVVAEFKLWCWATCLQRNGVEHFAKMWKGFTTNIFKAFIGDSPVAVPGGTLGFDMRRRNIVAMKFVRGSPFSWMEGIFYGDIPKIKPWGTRCAHLQSSRSFPTPTKRARDDARELHRNITRNEVDYREVTPDVKTLISRQAFLIGKRLRPRIKFSNAHVSLTNSAELNCPRSSGGKAVAIARDYLRWAQQLGSSQTRQECWHGTPFNEVPGRPLFTTMCRESTNFVRNHKKILEPDDDFVIDVAAWLEDPTKYEVRDCHTTGLDEAVGPQLLQWAIDTGIEKGYLGGSRFKSLTDPLYRTGKPLKFRYSTIGEPGLKSRPITVTEAWSDLFLSPFGHDIISVMDQDAECQAGLHAAFQGYELAKVLFGFEVTPDMCPMAGDLTQATEYIQDGAAIPALRGLFRGLGTLDVLRGVMIDTLLSPHQEVDFDREGNDVCHPPTERAALMGRPGSKGTLVLLVKVAKQMALYTTGAYKVRKGVMNVTPHLFRTAGDDFFFLAKKPLLLEMLMHLKAMGLMLNESKFLWGKGATRFCEEVLVWDHCMKSTPGRLQDVPYETHPHVDAIKVRLLCPLTKDSDGGLGRNDTNPAIGKAFMIAKLLNWFPADFHAMRETVVNRYRQRMGPYIDWNQPMVYLPPSLGGLGLVPKPEDVERLVLLLREMPAYVLSCVCAQNDGLADPTISRVLSSFAKRSSYRGKTLRDDGVAEINFMLEKAGAVVEDAEMAAMCGSDMETWHRQKRWVKAGMAKAQGYIPKSFAFNTLERPIMFKALIMSSSTTERLCRAKDELEEAYQEAVEVCLKLDHPDELKLLTQMGYTEVVERLADAKREESEAQFELERFTYVKLMETSDMDHREVVFSSQIIERPAEDIRAGRGFSQRPWLSRFQQMVAGLMLHCPDIPMYTPEALLRLEERIRDRNLAPIDFNPPAPQWVKRDKIESGTLNMRIPTLWKPS